MTLSKIVITCPPHINTILAKEVEDLGYEVKKINRMDVEIEGTFNDTMYLNLHLRTGYRVLFLVKSFKATTPEQLYDEVCHIKWEEIMDKDGYFSIQSYVKNDFIYDSKYANLKIKDAIADRFVREFGKRPDSGPSIDKVVLFLHWKLDQCHLYIDTSGETIAKHGYRKIPFKAPMLEALAAATIKASQWDGKSSFVNPMCGSGTLAIEAALIAINKAPGLMRDNFGFMHIKGYNYAYWDKIKKEAEEAVLDTISFKITASDMSPEALKVSRMNAAYAKVDHLISFELCDFSRTTIPETPGVVMINPEYGERLGEEEELVKVYQQIGDFFKKSCSGYMGYIFTGNMNLAKKIGLRAKRRIEFFNAMIDCRLLEYELYVGSKREENN
jgi:putative N6-adenine-specific DNA methylase